MKMCPYIIFGVLIVGALFYSTKAEANVVQPTNELSQNIITLKASESKWYSFMECNDKTFKTYGQTKIGPCNSDADCRANYLDGISDQLGARLVCCSGYCGVFI